MLMLKERVRHLGRKHAPFIGQTLPGVPSRVPVQSLSSGVMASAVCEGTRGFVWERSIWFMRSGRLS
jgi:hypothetical protein